MSFNYGLDLIMTLHISLMYQFSILLQRKIALTLNTTICSRPVASPPGDILAEIWKENEEFWQDMHMFDDDYIDFVWRLVKTVDLSMFLT